ncbi:DNA polymerase epsilon subunit 4 [Frankliniella fusca]|uniref:DNA polymerase epsilon subunit 4 n=1 Tax=Frankliniella fusca TaxID=407009 RepID=A0AAE1HJ85_9NEOP|nr:DNA polymerase epsilon subunit 4 [Frankliniella fusca]
MSEEKENLEANIAEEEKSEKLVKLPLSRIKSIIKMDPDVNLASQEAVFLIAKATELFIESLARESYTHTAQSKKKTVQKKDVDAAISSSDSLLFLEGTL